MSLLAIQYYWKLRYLYRKLISKSEFIYIYTVKGIVDKVMIKTRKNKYQEINDAPRDSLLLSRDKALPDNVMVQVKFNPLAFDLLEG